MMPSPLFVPTPKCLRPLLYLENYIFGLGNLKRVKTLLADKSNFEESC